MLNSPDDSCEDPNEKWGEISNAFPLSRTTQFLGLAAPDAEVTSIWWKSRLCPAYIRQGSEGNARARHRSRFAPTVDFDRLHS